MRLRPCQATLDDPKIAPLVQQMLANRTKQPVRLEERPKLAQAMKKIDQLNSADPSKMDYDGYSQPYRLLYSHLLTEWIKKLDPQGPDELYLLARGKSVEGWRLVEIKRDDFAPNSIGQKQWEMERRQWQADRLTGIMAECGYDEASRKLVEDVMLNKNLPDPRDVRLFDVTGAMGAVNYRLLELVRLIQVLRDGEALLFLEQSFPRALASLGAEEVLPMVKRELAAVSAQCLQTVLGMKWSAVQRKVIVKALPPPTAYGTVLREVEGVFAASTHPGDWRYRNFDYE